MKLRTMDEFGVGRLVDVSCVGLEGDMKQQEMMHQANINLGGEASPKGSTTNTGSGGCDTSRRKEKELRIWKEESRMIKEEKEMKTRARSKRNWVSGSEEQQELGNSINKKRQEIKRKR